MEDTIITTEENKVVVEAPIVSDAPAQSTRPQSRDTRGDSRGGRKPNRRAPRRDARAKPEFDQKIVSLRRVTRVTSGGRRFAFSVCVVAGNRKGMVGVGLGKAGDTPLAIEKAFRDAKKNMITANLTKDMSVPHEIESKFSASRVVIRPAPGKGILAGSSVRTVLELAGLREVSAKLLSRSKNSINNAHAAIEALRQLERTKIRHSK
jgi:small subunit ribosomal protein S5